MTYSIRFPCPRIAHAPLPLQLAEAGAQHYDGYGNPPVSTAVTDAGVLPCCEYSCGRPVPLIVNGNYNDPIGDGKTHIAFNVTNSPWCGISVAKVLRGDLEGLMQRDELAILNPRSKSMRLKIDWPGYDVFTPKINTPIDKFKIEDLARKVCAQIDKFMAKNTPPQVDDGPASEWMVEEEQVSLEQLMLVSVRRVSVGCWVPFIRLIGDTNGA